MSSLLCHNDKCVPLKTEVQFEVLGPGPAGLATVAPLFRKPVSGRCPADNVKLHLTTQVSVLPYELDAIGAGLADVLPYPRLQHTDLCLPEVTAMQLLYPDTNTILKQASIV